MPRATTATIRVEQETICTPPLLLAFELGANTWKRGGPTGAAPRPWERQGPAGACPAGLEERHRATSRVGWPEEARGVRDDAAGRGGLLAPPVLRQPGRGAQRGRRGKTRSASPRPPGDAGSPGWAHAAHAVAAACRWGKEGGACRAGAQRGRGRPPPAAPGTPAHATRADVCAQAEQRAAGWLWPAPGGAPGRCSWPSSSGTHRPDAQLCVYG
jgi:hypothetical protein